MFSCMEAVNCSVPCFVCFRLPLRNGSLHLCSVALCVHTMPFVLSSPLLPTPRCCHARFSPPPSESWPPFLPLHVSSLPFVSSFTHHPFQPLCHFLSFLLPSASVPCSATCSLSLRRRASCLWGSRLGMPRVLLCVSRTHSLSLLQLCGMMAPLTLGSAAVMVI